MFYEYSYMFPNQTVFTVYRYCTYREHINFLQVHDFNKYVQYTYATYIKYSMHIPYTLALEYTPSICNSAVKISHIKGLLYEILWDFLGKYKKI